MAHRKVVKAKAANAIAKVAPKAEAKGSTKADIEALIAKIKANVATLHTDVAIACAKIVTHAIEHGDVTLAPRLMAAFGDGKENRTLIRANMLKAWFETYGPFTWNSETKAFNLNKKKRAELEPKIKTAKDRQKFERELSETNKPWAVKPERTYKGINALQEIKRTIAKIEREAKKHADDPRTNVTYLDEFKKTLARVETMHADNLAKLAKAANN